jgi:hypothetical protein
MKSKAIIVGSLMCAALWALSGCNKEQPAADVKAPQPSQTVATPAPTAPAPAPSMTPDAAKAAEPATTTMPAVTNQAAVQTQPAEQQAQGIIDRAKSLIADNKYQDALGSLSQLKDLQLTAEQQKLVDDLKTKIQEALAKATTGDAASALGGALGGKK